VQKTKTQTKNEATEQKLISKQRYQNPRSEKLNSLSKSTSPAIVDSQEEVKEPHKQPMASNSNSTKFHNTVTDVTANSQSKDIIQRLKTLRIPVNNSKKKHDGNVENSQHIQYTMHTYDVYI
jgi:hypothetical protein